MKTDCHGFTLIEVLIALAIVAIALTAIVKASSSDIEDTIHLRDVTIAHWVGGDAIHRVQLGLTQQSVGSSIRRQTTMLNRRYTWIAQISKTPNPLIHKITVTVYDASANQPLATLHGFIRVNSA